MLTSYHVHTNRSDGEAPARDFVKAALDIHLDELGFSDHYVLVTGAKVPAWSMALDELPDYCSEISQIQAEMRGRLAVRCGIEADFDSATAGELAEVLEQYPFDYVIGSVHFVDGFPVDECKQKWDEITQSERNEVALGYLDRIEQMARSGLFDIVGHFDLYKKFGYLPTVDVSEPVASALDAIAESRMALEINASGLVKQIGEPYPSEHILRQCRARSIRVVITADAHVPQDLTRGYEDARALARRAGYDCVVRFEGRQMSACPL